MITTIFSTLLILAGAIYLWQTRKDQASPLAIALITLVGLCFIGSITNSTQNELDFKEILANKPLVISKIIAILSLVFAWIMLKKNWLILSWVTLILPLAYFMLPASEVGEKITAFSYVQVVGIGVVLPLLIHFLSVFISNMAPPRETAFNTHKQLISLLIGLVMIGFSVLMANFILGKTAIYFLASGIFSSALLFRGYNLNGQKHFPGFVMMLLAIFLFGTLLDKYSAELSMGAYQLISGLIFGAGALYLSAFCSAWAAESDGVFSKMIFSKAIFGPVVFILMSGLLFFVYEAFGGRLSLIASVLGAALVLPLLNQIFENRTYGGMAIILGVSILLIPHIEHNKQEAEIVIQEDEINTELAKLSYTDEQGTLIKTSLNDITQFQGKWIVDTASSIIEFKVAGTESVTDGFFKGFTGVLLVNEDYTATYLDIEIPIAGISTFNKTRDKNIRKDDIFFDEAKFPKIKYEAKNVRIENDQFIAAGTFTMKGISLPIETSFTLTGAGTINGKEALILEGSGALNRTKFGQTSDPSIGDEITFTFKTIFTIE
jgi:polyisoprenoid-binding protein YceI